MDARANQGTLPNRAKTHSPTEIGDLADGRTAGAASSSETHSQNKSGSCESPTVLLMLANSFPLNSTMEYTAPLTSFSARLCSFPGINPCTARLFALHSQGWQARGVQTSCSEHCSPQKLSQRICGQVMQE